MEYTDITLAVDEGVALITFNRPDAMNVFTTAMMDELGEKAQVYSLQTMVP